jgi:hypothetical protein
MLLFGHAFGQVKLGKNLATRAASSLLEMESDSLVFVPPRMTTAKRNTIASPLVGAVIYNTQDSCLQTWNGTKWHCVSASKRSNWFYAPSLSIPADTIYNNQTLDLYDAYVDQFQTPLYRSTGAPTSIPIYQSSQLYYYITYYDNTIINIDSLNASGVLQYDIIAVPDNDYTQINVVFLIKDP